MEICKSLYIYIFIFIYNNRSGPKESKNDTKESYLKICESKLIIFDLIIKKSLLKLLLRRMSRCYSYRITPTTEKS